MSCSAEALVFELHGILLRSVASATQLHFQGLSQASRYLRAHGLVSNSAAKKLHNIDCAYNLCRHITAISSKSFADQVIGEITHAVSNNAGSARENKDAGPEDVLVPKAPKDFYCMVSTRTDDSAALSGDISNPVVSDPWMDTRSEQSQTSLQPDFGLSLRRSAACIDWKADIRADAFHDNSGKPQISVSSKREDEVLASEEEGDYNLDWQYDKTWDYDFERGRGIFLKFYLNGRHLRKGKTQAIRGRRNAISSHRLALKPDHPVRNVAQFLEW